MRARQEGNASVTIAAAQTYDVTLWAVDHTPKSENIGKGKASVAVTDRGFIDVDIEMCINVPHNFARVDIVGQPMLAHKAVHDAHVAVMERLT